jgi:hypothetical protein
MMTVFGLLAAADHQAKPGMAPQAEVHNRIRPEPGGDQCKHLLKIPEKPRMAAFPQCFYDFWIYVCVTTPTPR